MSEDIWKISIEEAVDLINDYRDLNFMEGVRRWYLVWHCENLRNSEEKTDDRQIRRRF